MTNDDLNTLIDTMFNDWIEGRAITVDLDTLTSQEVTTFMAKFAAKCAEYAGDALDF